MLNMHVTLAGLQRFLMSYCQRFWICKSHMFTVKICHTFIYIAYAKVKLNKNHLPGENHYGLVDQILLINLDSIL